MSFFFKYNKILLIRLAWDQTGAKLSNMLDYQMVPVLTYILTSTFCYCPYI